ncbi:O-acetylhomoserine aminocarboxypropyltransferase [Platysternon megacephalum]|uniref:O-acetylhomoserine aminocarboxypropyltransferase n=1 Tax=Platysternon megacephalum TaxID=55544 RepID=A0A4D9DEC7_9SAUR|nr:O-acetylhomoserine aminocarboxypropyltransferase [Platysternon megacephalum]
MRPEPCSGGFQQFGCWLVGAAPAGLLTLPPSLPSSHLQSRVRVLVDGSLLLQKTTPDDAGKYTCVPSNGLRKPPSASAFLTVLYPAQVTTMPPETLLPMGMQGMIQCPTKANPPLRSISWTKDGHPLELDKFPGWSMAPDGSIVITTGNDDALGLYTCTPYNSYGTAGASAPTRVLLKVRGGAACPPHWLSRGMAGAGEPFSGALTQTRTRMY